MPQQSDYHCISSFYNLHRGWVTAVAFCPDGSLLASAGSDGTIFVTNLPRSLPLLCVDLETPTYATCLVWPWMNCLFVGRSDGVVQVFDVNSEEMSVTIIQALPTVVELPIRRMACDTAGDAQLLAVSYIGVTEIYKLTSRSEGWILVDEIVTKNRDEDLVTSLRFIRHPTNKYDLIITHAQAGFTFWKHEKVPEQQATIPIGGSDVARGRNILAATNLAQGGVDIFTLSEGRPWMAHERHYELDFNEEQNFEVPIRFVGSNTVVVGSTRGVTDILDIDSGEMTPVPYNRTDEPQPITSLDAHGANFATGSGNRNVSGVVRFFKPGPTALREASITTGLSESPHFSAKVLYGEYIRWRNARQREALSQDQQQPKKKSIKRAVNTSRKLPFAERSIYDVVDPSTLKALVGLLVGLIIIVVLADDPEAVPSPTSWRWIPAWIRYQICSYVVYPLQNGFTRTMYLACQSTGASCGVKRDVHDM